MPTHESESPSFVVVRTTLKIDCLINVNRSLVTSNNACKAANEDETKTDRV